MKPKKPFPYPPKICSRCGNPVSQIFQNLLRDDKKPLCQNCMYPVKSVKKTKKYLRS